MPESVTVPKASYDALLLGLLRTYNREDWLLEAAEMSETFGVPVSELIEGFLLPSVERFMKANKIPAKLRDKMLTRVHLDFSAIALPE